MVYGAPGRGHGGVPRPYWDESVHYTFAMDEVLSLEADVEVLHSMCLEAVDHVVTTERFRDFAIPEYAWEGVAASWKRSDPHVYGRFDLRYGGDGPAKLLEYNADTPTTLLEASILQWNWLKDTHPERRPVELHPREARRAVDADQGDAARRRHLLHLVAGATPPARTTSPSGTCRRPRPRPGSTPSGWRSRTSAGTPRWTASSISKRPFDGRGLQALPVGVGAHRRLRQARAAQPPRDAVARAAVEGDPVQQGPAGRAVGDVPRPPQPAARLSRPARDAHRVRAQAPAGPGGRQHLDRLARLGDRDARRVRRGGLRLPALRPAARVRRLPARAGRVDRRRRLRRAGHPRDGRPGHRRRRGVRSRTAYPRTKTLPGGCCELWPWTVP